MSILGPLRALKYIHTALERELELLEADAMLSLKGSVSFEDLSERFNWTGYVLDYHAKGEDIGVFGTVNDRMPHVATTFEDDHRVEETLREEMTANLAAFGEGNTSAGEAFARQCSQLLHTTVRHMNKEEAVLVPIIEANFSLEEQGGMMGKMMGAFPQDFMAKGIPWVFKRLDSDTRVEYAKALQGAMPPAPFSMHMNGVEQALEASEWIPISEALQA